MTAVRGSWQGGGGEWSILVHGGAGDVPADRLASHEEGCRLAVEAAVAILAAGGPALDAAQRAVETLEDDPRFNAGTGASLDERGELRLDAAIMDGSSLAAGAVCSLPAFRHPIAVARAVLADGKHVLYAAEGAALFAEQRGFSRADPGSMISPAALARLAETRAGATGNWAGGTVGAVVRDRLGHLAAATSTGGLVGKRQGRVGDSPIVGAGTYADDRSGAVSGTGEGEGYLRTCAALRTALWLEEGLAPDAATSRAVTLLLERVNARGGLICVDPRGRLGLARSTGTMSWAAAWSDRDGILTGH
jgi:beta-aspartyl-peptidase (threonine type)